MVEVLTASEREQAAEQATAELDSALRAVGVALPSLCVDQVSAASTFMAPLVELGRCNVETARRLAEVLAEYAKGAAYGHDARDGQGPEGRRR
ncbi:hypothetical protein [Streptomyces sp. GS7]|uniref:hypothetical protein n=1 Tax=Streptomyces sp. GS7 TaxID=2692234 RepID=UPI00131696F5|nr:hypothetical protein [Streptomyces sp. GS7]QHC25975.1 hypothetical protein GR130_35920 [Streptomyces sp. GS7]